MEIKLPNDRYWRSIIHIFTNCARLQGCFTKEYFDLNERCIYGDKLLRKARGWSHSEMFMLKLGLHLFNERYKVNLSDMDYLDPVNRSIAIEAIQIRFC